jgi:hypothetical protein
MYTYHCHNTKHVHVPLGIASITACFQDTDLPESFAVETSNFAVAALLIQRHLTTKKSFISIATMK